MNKKEYSLQIEQIKQQYGEPETAIDGTPVNESAKKLAELHIEFNKTCETNNKHKKLKDTIKKLRSSKTDILTVPDEAISEAWFVQFTDLQKRIARQFLRNIKQTNAEIASALDTTIHAVQQTKSLSAFKALKKHVTRETLEILDLEAVLELREVMHDPNVSTKLKALMAVLMNAGYIKSSAIEGEAHKAEIVINSELAEKLRKQAEGML